MTDTQGTIAIVRNSNRPFLSAIVKGATMGNEKSKMVPINYKLADGKTVPVEVSPVVARFLEKEEQRERTRRRDDRRFLDAVGYVEGESELLIHDLGESVVAATERKERAALINGAIATLAPRRRSYIHAYYFKGMTLQEIAGIEGLNRATVGRVLQKAVNALRDALLDRPETYGYEGVWQDDR